MAYTVDQLSALESAIAGGLLTVEIGDRRTTYQSLEQMRALRDEMRAELQVASPARKAAIMSISTGKGY